MSNTWLVYFDCDGFEVIMNVTQIGHDNMIKRLSDKPLQSIPLEQMKLRARFNSQRRPEIWIFNADKDIDQSALDHWAAESPQTMADWIRENGSALYRDSNIKNKHRIV